MLLLLLLLPYNGSGEDAAWLLILEMYTFLAAGDCNMHLYTNARVNANSTSTSATKLVG